MKPREVMHPPLAYKDEKFLESEDARSLRILAEYLSLLKISSEPGCEQLRELQRLRWSPVQIRPPRPKCFLKAHKHF